MKNAFIAFLLLASLGAFLQFSFAADAPKAVLKSYDVSLVTLDKPISRLTDPTAAAPTQYTQAWLVRLHGDFPVQGAQGMRLFVGNEYVEEFGGLPDGIYFRVYEKSVLDRMTGGVFKYSYAGSEPRTLNIKFNPSQFAPFKSMPEKEALVRP
jgi:hypothetical protein